MSYSQKIEDLIAQRDALQEQLNLALGTIESRARNIETVVAENRELKSKLTALEGQEPVAYRFPKAGIANGYNYCESMDGEEPRFYKVWEKLYAAAGAAPDNREKRLKDALGQVFGWPTEEQPDGTVIPVDPSEMLVGAAPTTMTQAIAEELAHRRCKRYRKIDDVPYQFDAHTLMDFVRDVEKAGAAPVPEGFALLSTDLIQKTLHCLCTPERAGLRLVLRDLNATTLAAAPRSAS